MTEKWAFIDNLLQVLFHPDFSKFKLQTKALVDANNTILGVDHNGFQYKGKFFDKAGDITDVDWGPRCQSAVMPDAEMLLSAWKKVNYDCIYLRDFFRDLLAPCRTDQEVRDALPEVLMQFIPKFQCLLRERGAGYTLLGRTDPFDSSDVVEVAEQMCHRYAAMHMIV